jgi:hypothetical protein
VNLTPTRTYECRNPRCPHFRVPALIPAGRVGAYWAFTVGTVVCDCKHQVPVVAVNGEPLKEWAT